MIVRGTLVERRQSSLKIILMALSVYILVALISSKGVQRKMGNLVRYLEGNSMQSADIDLFAMGHPEKNKRFYLLESWMHFVGKLMRSLMELSVW